MIQIGMRTKTVMGAAVAFALSAGPLAAAPPPDPQKFAGQSQALQSLSACRKLTDNTARLACFDQAAAALDQAQTKGDIVVVDREQARSIRRQAFGFSLPSFSLFERGEKPEEVDNMTGKVASARMNGAGKWVLRLEDGAIWAQIDTTEVFSDPKPGTPVKIRRAAMGSYLLTLGNNRAFRAHREE